MKKGKKKTTRKSEDPRRAYEEIEVDEAEREGIKKGLRKSQDMSRAYDEAEKHPSFGMVAFSRRNACGAIRHRLFGSSIDRHYTVIALTIKRAEMVHHLASDHPFGREQLIEVELSEAQFASLLTTMNIGDGVPCTIRWVKGEGQIDPPPLADVEVVKVRKGFEEDIKEMVEQFETIAKEAEELLSKPRLNKAERERLKFIFFKAAQDLRSNHGFIIEQFGEATEKVVTEAKADVDAFITHAAVTTGLARLKELAESGESPLKLIEVEDKDEEEGGD